MASSSLCLGQPRSPAQWLPWQWTHLSVWGSQWVWLWPSDAHFLQTSLVTLHHFIVCPYWLHFRHNIGRLLNGYTTVSHLYPCIYIEYGGSCWLKVTISALTQLSFVLMKLAGSTDTTYIALSVPSQSPVCLPDQILLRKWFPLIDCIAVVPLQHTSSR